MATITTINWTDNITDSRAVINTNFTNLNNDKVEKVTWKGLSTEDYTTTEKNKLAWIETGAEVNNISDINATDLTDWWDTILHIHDWRYYTEIETDSLLNAKQNTLTAWTNITIIWNTISATWWVTTLDWLTNVTITTPANWQALTYNGTQWVNTTPTWAWDMLKSENLSWLSNYATARQNLWMDTTANQTDSTNKRFMSDAQESKLDWIDMSLKLDKALTNLSWINLNTITDNGFYCADTTCTNLPETWVKTRLRVNKDPSNANLSMQEALTTTTLVSYVRTTANGWNSWTSWTRIKATDETKEPLKWADDNYVTDAQLVVIGNTSNTNSWDETKASIESKLTWTITSHNHSWVYQPLATVLTNTTASYTTTIDTRLANTSWTNTWDNAVNSLYSWLATSKQDTLVSWTNIKTVNWTSLLWSWNIVISGGGWAIRKLFAIAWSIWTTWTNVANTIVVDWTYTISQVNMWYWTAWNWTLTVDINKNGTTLFASVKPTITTTNQSSINTWTLTTTSLSSGDVLTIDIDAVPWTPWTDLYVEIIYS